MKTTTTDYSKLIKKCREVVKCDTARISRPLVDGKMYLIIGFNRNTKDDEGQYIDENGVRKDFDYTQESVVASGFTEEELITSVKEYVRLSGMTCEDYIHELVERDKNRLAK